MNGIFTAAKNQQNNQNQNQQVLTASLLCHFPVGFTRTRK